MLLGWAVSAGEISGTWHSCAVAITVPGYAQSQRLSDRCDNQAMAEDFYFTRLAELRAQLNQLGPRLNDPTLSEVERTGIIAARVPIYDAIEALGSEVEEC
jgi:hypothetical protein